MGREAGTPDGQAPDGAQPQDGNPTAGTGDSGDSGQAPPAAGDSGNTGDAGELSKVRREAGEWRTKFRGAETSLTEANTALEAERGKASSLEQENARLKTEVRDFKVRGTVADIASKLGFRSPELAYRVLDRSALKFDDKGNPSNAEELLKALLESDPYLAKPDSDFGGGNQGGSPKDGPGMNDLIRIASGR